MKGYALGQAIDRMARLPLVVCSLLAWVAGVLSRPRVFAALVGFIAVGVWMHGGLAEIHWPQWAKIGLPQWSQQSTADSSPVRANRDAMDVLWHPHPAPPGEGVEKQSPPPPLPQRSQEEIAREAMDALSKPAVSPAPQPAALTPSYTPQQVRDLNRLIDNARHVE